MWLDEQLKNNFSITNYVAPHKKQDTLFLAEPLYRTC